MSAALGLLRLQKIDSSLDQLQARLDQIRADLQDDREITTRRVTLGAAEESVRQIEQARQDAEKTTKLQRAKLEQAESSLYGGGVHNPKELQDLQADVVSLKKHLAVLDEAELEAMLRLEAAEEALKTARQDLDAKMGQNTTDHDRLRDIEAGLLQQVSDLKSERTAAEAALSSGMRQEYETLRKSRRGLAVSEIHDNACIACGTQLTAALEQSARHSTELVHCPSCGRILYGG